MSSDHDPRRALRRRAGDRPVLRGGSGPGRTAHRPAGTIAGTAGRTDPAHPVQSAVDTRLAERVLSLVAHQHDGAVVLLGSAAPGAGGYGLVSIDPFGEIEVRLFGWPRLTPGHDHHAPTATAAVRHDGFAYDGRDWVWRRTYRPELVTVAAYAAQRALTDGWSIVADDTTAMVRPVLLDAGDLALVESGAVCGRCIGDACVGVPHDSGTDGC